jgi:osmoprotectant transport system permease protein
VAPGGGVVIATPVFASFGGAVEFIFTPQSSSVTGGQGVGGIDQVVELMLTQLEVTLLALALALLLALPAGLYFGHRGAGEFVALGLGNAGRAVPELALIALMAAVIGVGLLNLTVALAILGIPPILTNTFVGIRQVDRASVEAARGMGMTEFEIVRKVEAPMAIPSIFTGIRTATINIVATATIAPLAGVATLGEFILGENVYGPDGVLAGAILVALLALALEFSLAGLQRVLTSKGLKLRPA